MGAKFRSHAKYLLRAINFTERLAAPRARDIYSLGADFNAARHKILKHGLGATSAESAANGKITDKVAFKPRDKIAILSRLMRIVFQTASAQLGLRLSYERDIAPVALKTARSRPEISLYIRRTRNNICVMLRTQQLRRTDACALCALKVRLNRKFKDKI